MNYKNLRVESANSITTITLHRPEAENSLNAELIEELRAEFDRLRMDQATRAIIITSAGRAFSAGADLKMLTRLAENNAPDQTRDEIGKWRATFETLETLPQVTIAAVNGLALGAGVVLALACDFRLASSRAIFGFPEIKLGIVLALGGMNRLTRLVG